MIKVVNKKYHTPTEYDYYIARPSPVGNPFTHKKSKYKDVIVVETRDDAIDMYKEWLEFKIKDGDQDVINELDKLMKFYIDKGKINLVCWCKPKRCHGDIIKDFMDKKLKNI